MLEGMSRGDPSPGLELAVLSEAVLHILEFGVEPSERDEGWVRSVFRVAEEFLAGAIRGGETSQSLRLRATSWEDLPAYDLGKRAIEKGRNGEGRDHSSTIVLLDHIRSLCARLAEGDSAGRLTVSQLSDEERGELSDFFRGIDKVVRSNRAAQIDRVSTAEPKVTE